MDWRILASTFALIFLAELGDKTQLAALAAAAGSRSTWSVFVGASLALVLSTLVAVLVGDGLQRVIPLAYIKAAAGGLFILFGVLLLVSVWHGAPAAAEPEVSVAPAAVGKGVVVRIALEAAVAFEEAALNRYIQMAEAAETPEAGAGLRALVAEEKRHLAHLGSLLAAHGESLVTGPTLPDQPEALAAQPAGLVLAPDVFEEVIRHERAAAAFFRELAKHTALPAVRAAFQALAADEDEHARALAELRI